MDLPPRPHGPVSEATALSLRAVTKRFGDVLALDGAGCDIRRGSVHALLGENGAGKSTLMRVAYGLLRPDAGELLCDGRPRTFRSSRDARAAGIGMVHQHFLLVPAFTVAENVALGGRGRFDARAAIARVQALGEDTGLVVDPRAYVRDLPVAAQQRVELLRALAENPQLLVLDEPTAVLTPTESDELYAWMRRFTADGGTVVLITHKLREALSIADDLTVLRRGRTVLTGRCRDLGEGQLVTAVVGGEAPELNAPPTPATGSGAAIFALQAASVTDARGVPTLRETTLEVRAGEMLGVLGVDGAGQDELLRLLAGRLAPTTGRVTRPSPVGFIPGDRLQDAVIPELSLVENLVLSGVGPVRGRVDWRARRTEVARLLSEHDVRAAGADAPLRSLSGGNQQRFVVGRERGIAPQALVAEHPTRGLDVRATARVHEELRAVARAGGAVVLHSADLDEVLSLTSRIVVCFRGTVTEIPPPADPADRTPYARALLGVAS